MSSVSSVLGPGACAEDCFRRLAGGGAQMSVLTQRRGGPGRLRVRRGRPRLREQPRPRLR
jgi:hypothetical protein